MTDDRFVPISPRLVPRFAGAPSFLRLPFHDDPGDLDVMVVGLPFDGGTTFRPGARFGPRAVREASSLTRGYHPDQAIDPFRHLRCADGGDVACVPMDIERTLDAIAERAGTIARAGAVGAFVGGDHTVALGTLRGLARVHGPLGLVHFDAHTDTYGPAWDVDPHHGTIFRNAVEEGLLRPADVIQVGLRGPFSMEEDLAWPRGHGFETVMVDDVKRDLDGVCRLLAARAGRGKHYVSFDIDAVDPAYAPGTGTPVPGGLTSWEAQQLVRALRGVEIVGLDLVEVSPPSDHAGITSLLGAVLLAEMIAVHAATRVAGARKRATRRVSHAATLAKKMGTPRPVKRGRGR